MLRRVTQIGLNTYVRFGNVGVRKCSVSAKAETLEDETHFGYETVKTSQKAEKVREVFDVVSSNYDLMNDAMSLSIHRLWKDIFIERLGPTPGTKLLDVAGGTGDIAFRFLKYLKYGNKGHLQTLNGHVTVCDINDAMLSVGKSRALTEGWSDEHISWVQGDAEKLPFDDNTFSAYTIAFGIRNVTHMNKSIEEAHRVLQPGGRFLCLEFSHVTNQYIQWLYDQYSFQLIPVMGQLLVGQWKPYKYLVESIRKMPQQEEMKQMIEDAGFSYVTYENLSFGIVAIHSGFKI